MQVKTGVGLVCWQHTVNITEKLLYYLALMILFCFFAMKKQVSKFKLLVIFN